MTEWDEEGDRVRQAGEWKRERERKDVKSEWKRKFAAGATKRRSGAGIDFVGSRHSNGTQQHAHTDTRPAAAALLSVLANSPHDHSHSPVGSVSVTLTAIRDFGLLNHGYSYGYGYVKWLRIKGPRAIAGSMALFVSPSDATRKKRIDNWLATFYSLIPID